MELERRLVELPQSDGERDQVWLKLEATIDQLLELLSRLAATPSTDAKDLRSKATIVAQLLQAASADPGTLTPQALALALAVAEEASNLV